MYTKLITLLLVCSIGASITFSNGSNDRYRAIKIVPNGDVFRGDTGPIVNRATGIIPVNDRVLTPPMVFNSATTTWTISEVSVDGRSQYDLQSNGNTNYIVQNPTNPLNMHACFMVATDPNPWDTRNVRYFYTSNGGTSWEYIGTVTTARSGFPCITMTTNDRAVILNHSTDGGGVLRGQIYVDAAPGAGAWTRLDPGITGGTITPIWPDAMYDRVSNKLLFGVSQQTPGDSLFRNVCTNLTAPGTFLGYQHVPGAETAEQYAFAVTNDGSRYGLAYCTNTGGAEYITSTDDGVTWSAPTVLWTWNPADSMGTLRTVDLVYDAAGTPKVLVGLGHVDPVGGTFTPGLPSKVFFWSPGINGGNPVTIDSADGLNGSNPTNDVFFSVTRSVIGMSADNNAIYVAYNKSRLDTSDIGNNFFDVWFRYSSTGGATWSPKTQLTNVTGPLNDCRYPAISPSNHVSAPNHYAHMVVMSDSIPGSNVNGAPASTSKMMYIKLQTDDPIGIHNIGGEVPGSYQLYQNFPNPFNPSTKIKFALPKSGFVTLKLYDVLGKEIGTLISEDISAGTFEYVLNANSLPSGVYFYSLRAGDYSDSKKMILVK